MPDNNRLVPTPAPADLVTFKILIDGTQISDTIRVLTVSINKEAGRISEAEISLLDGDAATESFDVSNTADFIPGKKVEVTAGYHGNESTVFKGVIVKHGIKIIQGEATSLNIVAKHAAFKTTLSRASNVYEKKKDSEIIEQILDDAGIGKDVASTTIQHNEMLQYNCTNWDFINMRAEANGMYVMLNDDKAIVKAPDANAATKLDLYYGSSILEFEAEMDARVVAQKMKSKSWKPSDQTVAASDVTSSLYDSLQGNISANDLAGKISNAEEYFVANDCISEAELTAATEATKSNSDLAKIRGRAKCTGTADVQVGDLINLNGVGDRFSGKAFVSGIHHSITEGNWETDIQFGVDEKKFAERFEDIIAKPASGLLPAVNGLQIAVVTKLESDPESAFRIKVKFPLFSGSDNELWARVATLDAGKDRGSFFLPEIGDEVVVSFLDDDPRHPVILGMMNSGDKAAPVTAADANNEKGFYTRSKMKLVFDDDKKSITVLTPGGNEVVISDDAKGIQMKDQNGNKIILDDNGISIESAKDIKIKASGDLKMEGTNTEMKANAQAKIEGSAGTKINSSAITEIKGSIVNIN